jgi:thiol-disulfide isomerase/thioredoxin
MANLVDYISGKLRPYSRYITFSIIFIIFVLISIYVLVNFVNKKDDEAQKFKDVANTGNRLNEIEVMMFHVDWCPHCKKALPEWYPFCDQYNNTKVNGYTIKCNRDGTNCTSDEDPKIASIISQYKIESYPTIIIMREGKRYDFDAKITKSALEQFVESVTSSSK